MSIQFFWDKSGKKSRSRFNLLLLEYGEVFLEDISVYHYPIVPIWTDKSSILRCDGYKVQGRIKLCSKSLIFEPNETRRPVLKFPFKSFTSNIMEPRFGVRPMSPISADVSLDSFCIFTFKTFLEIKANDKVGPYRVLDVNHTNTGDDLSQGHGCFALIHSDLKTFLSKVDQLLRAFRAKDKSDFTVYESLMNPILSKASTVVFDSSMLVDFHEQLLLKQPVSVSKIKPLISNPGVLMITQARVYFQPAQLNNLGDSFQCFELSKVERMYCRRFMLQQIGLEFILTDGSSSFFTFESHSVRDSIYELINAQASTMRDHKSLDEVTRMWQRGEMNNYQYLLYLNSEADRSFNDLTQYPVFPHIIQDFVSAELDLSNPNTFRDLSKPIGALNASRLEYFKERYHSMPPVDEELGLPPPFLYGTHYSTPAYVLFYLVRVAPEQMLCLQNGKFDATDRMFNSIAETWESCLTNHADLKELIPEFFVGNGEFLVNSDDLDLGYRHTGGRLNDVELPPWAKNPRDFIRKCSKALECEYVSQSIHHWIDLIFGYKSSGPNALKYDNLYYYLTYEGAVDLEHITDANKRAALEIQIQEFGQTPKQLFIGPHPRRDDLKAPISLRYPKIEKNALSGHNSWKGIKTPTSDKYNSPQSNIVESPTNDTSEIINLGDDFRAEVERELSLEKTRSMSSNLKYSNSTENLSNSQSFSSLLSGGSKRDPGKPNTPVSTISSYLTDFALKTASITDRTLGTKLLPTFSNTFSSKNTEASPPQESSESTKQSTTVKSYSPSSIANTDRIKPSSSLDVLTPSSSSKEKNGFNHDSIPPIHWNTKPMNVKQIVLEPSEPTALAHNRITGISMIISTEAVTESTQNQALKAPWKALLCSSSKDGTLKVFETHSSNLIIVPKRTFSSSDPALTCCHLLKDGHTVFASSWDNYMYNYSIPNARLQSKQLAHDDGITSFSIDESEKYILTGSNDGTVKLWTMKNGNMSSVPLAEFYDHENPITAVSITSDGKYASAGADDGKIIVWDIRTGGEVTSYQMGRGGICLLWIPKESTCYHQIDFAPDKVVAASQDGRIICIDTSGRLFAAGTLTDVYITCFDTDGVGIYGGCDDGSVRVWVFESGLAREVHRYLRAHTGPVSAIKIDKISHVLITCGIDGTIRIWNTYH